MEIRKALPADLQAVGDITRSTIAAVYPHYYPQGAVDFFLWLHSPEAIQKDIEAGRVYLLLEGGAPVGTVTLRGQDMCRLFVLPEHQGKGFGGALMGFAEKAIGEAYGKITLDAALPAKALYHRHGYHVVDSQAERMENGDYLCWDTMEKLWGECESKP